jgi:hypothetical protein
MIAGDRLGSWVADAALAVGPLLPLAAKVAPVRRSSGLTRGKGEPLEVNSPMLRTRCTLSHRCRAPLSREREGRRLPASQVRP